MKTIYKPAGDNHVYEIILDQIRPAPYNPPSRTDPEKVKELAESIRLEGQQSPALLRPVEAEAPIHYEIVWGHRRFAALQLLVGTGVSPVHLKAFIREMTEEQAMISSGIENLQREGFSDIEEAEFFRTCGDRYGESAVNILAEKLSVSDRYIRKRLEILKLPDAALELWRAGIWHIGHMEQLLRLGENDQIEAFLDKINDNDLHKLPVWQLQDLVDRQALPLHSGRFDKAECKACRKNTDVQRRLFGSEKEKTLCLDQDCFQAKEQAWLDVHWPGCNDNKFGTQTAVITGEPHSKTTGIFSKWGPKPTAKCKTCPQFSTIIKLGGYQKARKFQVWTEMACLGDAKCYAAAGRAGKQDQKSGTGNQKSGGAGVSPAEEAPRVAWHGEHFRQEFYRQEIPVLMANLLVDDPRRLQLALAVMVHSVRDLGEWLCGKVGAAAPPKSDWQEYAPVPFPRLLELVKSQNGMQAEFLLAEAITLIALRNGRGYETTFSDPDRQALAEFLHINFANFQVTGEYLEKKTKAEIVRFIVHDSGLLEVLEFKDALMQRGFSAATPERLAAAKKPVLVELLLNCGVDLHGRLPREIADLPSLKTGN